MATALNAATQLMRTIRATHGWSSAGAVAGVRDGHVRPDGEPFAGARHCLGEDEALDQVGPSDCSDDRDDHVAGDRPERDAEGAEQRGRECRPDPHLWRVAGEVVDALVAQSGYDTASARPKLIAPTTAPRPVMVTSFATTTSRRRGEMRNVGTLVPWRNSPAIEAMPTASSTAKRRR